MKISTVSHEKVEHIHRCAWSEAKGKKLKLSHPLRRAIGADGRLKALGVGLNNQT